MAGHDSSDEVPREVSAAVQHDAATEPAQSFQPACTVGYSERAVDLDVWSRLVLLFGGGLFGFSSGAGAMVLFDAWRDRHLLAAMVFGGLILLNLVGNALLYVRTRGLLSVGESPQV